MNSDTIKKYLENNCNHRDGDGNLILDNVNDHVVICRRCDTKIDVKPKIKLIDIINNYKYLVKDIKNDQEISHYIKSLLDFLSNINEFYSKFVDVESEQDNIRIICNLTYEDTVKHIRNYINIIILNEKFPQELIRNTLDVYSVLDIIKKYKQMKLKK